VLSMSQARPQRHDLRGDRSRVNINQLTCHASPMRGQLYLPLTNRETEGQGGPGHHQLILFSFPVRCFVINLLSSHQPRCWHGLGRVWRHSGWWRALATLETHLLITDDIRDTQSRAKKQFGVGGSGPQSR
jgi:hypothetical protein